MNGPRPDLLTDLLRDVSRSFYLTLRVLPEPVRAQIGLAYLLARATDTIADSDLVPVADRLALLRLLRDRILGGHDEPLDFTGLAEGQALPAERALLERIEEAIEVLAGFSCFDRCCVREVITTITSGQELDLVRFQDADSTRIVALETQEELDDYTYRVAGCVGGFWTRLCRAHLFPDTALDLARYVDDAVRFGKGLQLVNILRDLPGDLRKGRCYLPADGLARHGLQPEDLLDPAREPRLRPLYREHLATASAHLEAGWRYTCTTPVSQSRARLACALPLLIGAETVSLLGAGNNVLDPTRRIKVPRPRVRWIMVRSVALVPFRRRWEAMFRTPIGPIAAPPPR
ncbi:MAG: squalene/phytoene synthase family protein [Verrucomicrobiales bacterium]|nr:squalene/phytoene synthase family protein [Verrucomicrobiales bacterium]